MRYFILLFTVVFFVALVFFQLNPNGIQAFDKSGCEMDCQKCHTITNQEIKDILNDLKAPDAEILKVQLSPVRGLWEVAINNKGKPGLFYVDFSKKFIVSGSIIEVKTGQNKTMEGVTKLQDTRRVDFSRIPLNHALVMGNVISPKKVAVFTDPDCNFCEKLHKEMVKALAQPDVKAAFAKQVMYVKASDSPEAYSAFIKSETERLKNLVQKANIKPEQ